MSRITRLEVHDFKRIECAMLEPNGSLVQIAGNNGHGKSSVLDAIQAALGGKRALPADPIRHGARKADIVLETDDFKILRTFSPTGTRLEVWGPQGKVKSPQAVLDGLTKSLTFDPLAFERMDAKAQAETLRELAGLDTSVEEIELARAFDARRDVNREVKRLEAKAGGPAPHPVAPHAETPVSELMAKLDEAQRVHSTYKEAEQSVQNLRWKLNTDRGSLMSMERELKELAERIERAREDIEERENHLAEEEKTVAESAKDLPDIDAIRAKIGCADEVNAKVRANARHAALVAELTDTRAEADKLTSAIETLRGNIARKIEAANFPIEGLAVTDDGVEFRGVPFAQASGAERLRVSAAIGLALNPRLRILLIRDGSLLDETSLASLDAFAEENDCQIFLEVVGDRPGAAIVMEDGRAKQRGKEVTAA